MRTRVVCAALSAVASVAGCAKPGPAPLSTEAIVPAPVDPIINAAAFGEPEGLEIRWWILRDDAEVIASRLRPYLGQPLPIDAPTAQRLHESGLRLVAIPMADLMGLRSRLPLVGRIDRRWIGQTSSWIEGVSGPRFATGRTVRLGDERLSLPPGALRLLTRAWKEPGVERGRLRIDLAIQHVDAAALDPQRSVLEFSSSPSIVDEGLVFSSTLAEISSGDAYFYLLVPESPDRDWLADDEDEDEGENSAGNDESSGEASQTGEAAEPTPWTAEATVEESLVQGPPAAGVPTLGELMLMQAPDPMTGRSLRAVIVLVPRVRTGQSLLP